MFVNETARVGSCDSQVFKWISDGEPVRLVLLPRHLVNAPGLPAPASKSDQQAPKSQRIDFISFPSLLTTAQSPFITEDLLNRLQDLQKLAQEQELSQFLTLLSTFLPFFLG